MKVTCEGCKAFFKVKGEVAPGKAFKFKCPKCGFLNRLKSENVVEAPAPKVKCEDCEELIPQPAAGEPVLCDQCRASRAVKEAQKLRAQAEESPLPEGVEFRDDLFSDEAEAPSAADKGAGIPARADEDVSQVTDNNICPPAEKEKEKRRLVERPFEKEKEEEEEAAPELACPEEPVKPPPSISEKEAPKAAFSPPKPETAEEEEEEEEEEVVIGAPPPTDVPRTAQPETGLSVPPAVEKPSAAKPAEPQAKPATPDSTYSVRSSDGLVIGPIKLKTLKDLIIAKKVHSGEEFSRDGGPYMSMSDFPELFEIFESETVAKAKETEEEVVMEDLTRLKMSKDKLLAMLKVKKNCVGCGQEVFVIEDIPNPLCDQCRIEAMVAKKSRASKSEDEAMYRVRSPDGLVLGPLRRATVEDLVAAHNIRGVEEVSVNDGPWKPIVDLNEFSGLFEPPSEDVIDLTESAEN